MGNDTGRVHHCVRTAIDETHNGYLNVILAKVGCIKKWQPEKGCHLVYIELYATTAYDS